MKKWYTLYVQPKREEEVKDNIIKTFNNSPFQDNLGDIIIPSEQKKKVEEVKQDGFITNTKELNLKILPNRRGRKKVERTPTFFPGYIFIELEYTPDIFYLIRDIPKVAGFVGGTKVPVPLSDEEIEDLRKMMIDPPNPYRDKLPKVNDRVVIKEGPLKDFTGIIHEIDPDKGKAIIHISVFGRMTPSTVDVNLLEKIQS